MLARINIERSKSWKLLEEEYNEIRSLQLKTMFEGEPDRIEQMTVELPHLLLDYSKNRIRKKTMNILCEVAEEMNLQGAIDQMFSGELINETENRSVLHIALRKPKGSQLDVRGTNVMDGVHEVLSRIEKFTDLVRDGHWKGFTGKRITDIVNIGIGGSDLGPHMVCNALKPFWLKRLNAHFISNVDGAALDQTLAQIDPETTMFVIVSKTFTTQETMTNADSARRWFLSATEEKADVSRHFIAVTTNKKDAGKFGILKENCFEFWDWVGGRYSLSSSVGLIIALMVGFRNFSRLLKGMHQMDEHFRHTPFASNMPVILALLGIWYRNFLHRETYAVIPYSHDLSLFAKYLQQLDMESNGKRIGRDGRPVSYQTGPIIWGEPGTNGQHAFFQLLHQGTSWIPCDFIIAARPNHSLSGHHKILVANCLAQSEAMMMGKSEDEVRAELEGSAMDPEEIEKLVPYKTFPGNRPTNTIIIDQLNPYTLGMLISLYEHKVFVQGFLWNIFSFDQWGVELGKQLAKKILPELQNSELLDHDPSTNQLIKWFRDHL